MHAARLLALIELRREGRLTGVPQQEIADLLDAGHRSTVMRLLRQLDAVEALAARLKLRFPERR